VSVVSVYTVFATREEAERIGRLIIEEQLAACVNILAPCRSIYRWQDAVETADEVPAIFKTTAAITDSLISRIALLHSYEVPAITVWPVHKLLAAYGDWVEDSIEDGANAPGSGVTRQNMA
jgi:periplasmic divalent cation tolerance protein